MADLNLSAMTKAGFVATPKEWDDLVTLAEELARRLVLAQAATPQLCKCADEVRCALAADRDAARAECAELRETRAALEQARALLAELENARSWSCMFCGADFDTGHAPDCKLAAALAAGSGGAA